MKTPEEIKSAVLKECERLCPKGTKEHVQCDGFSLEWIDWGDVMEGGLRLYGIADWMYIEPKMDDRVALHAYRILNIEARELEERAQGLVEAVQNLESSEFLLGKCDKFVEDETAVMPYLSIPAVQQLAKTALNQWKGGGNG